MLIDTHAHLDADAFEGDRLEMLARSRQELEHVIIPAIEQKNWDALLEFVQQNQPFLKCGIGVHPHHAHEVTDSWQEVLRQKAEYGKVNNFVVAVGECGLDYYYDFCPKDVQRDVFRAQLRLAKELRLPVIIHNRDSDDDMFQILTEEQNGDLQAVMHCFSGTPEQALKAVELGLHVSFTGNITYKKSTLAQTVAAVPLEKIMIETDSPYMTPVPHRGKRNEPMYVQHVAEKIAEIHSVTLEKVITMTSQTAHQFFRLSLFVVCFLSGIVASYAQQTITADDTEDVEEYRPYRRSFGFGALLGTNTIVRTFEKRGDVSADGILSFGAVVNYSITDKLHLQLSYMRSQNNKPLEILPVEQRQTNPNIHQVLDFAAQYIPNPQNRINFAFSAGASYLMNQIDINPSNGYLGFNVGLGVLGNIKVFNDSGIITPFMEWRVSIAPNAPLDEKFIQDQQTYTQKSFLFSIVRFGLMYNFARQ